MVQVIEEHALEQNWRLSIAIVDAGGHLILLQRMDNAILASIEIAKRKALSALSYRSSTEHFERGVAAGKTGLLALPGAVAFAGGLPVLVGDELIGAIGVSGAQGHEDSAAAKLAIDYFIKG